MKRFTITTLLLFALATPILTQDESAQNPKEAEIRKQIAELEKELANPEVEEDRKHLIEKEIARRFIAMGDFEKGADHMQKSIEMQENPVVQEYQALGELLLRTERIPEALKILRRAETSYPDSKDIVMMQAMALRFQEKWTPAVKKYQKLEKMFTPEELAALNASFYFQYGSATERSGDIENAEQLFQKCLEKIPEDESQDEFRAQVLNYLGYMWLENDTNIEVAGQLIKKARNLSPDSGAIADSLGWFYFKKERYIEAMGELIEAEALMEEPDPVVMDHIAQVFHKLGNREEALSYMKKARDLDPKNEEYQQRLAEFQKEQAE